MNTPASDVSAFRRAERSRLIEARLGIPAAERHAHAAAIARALDALVPAGPETVVSLYWPFRGEPDLRAWMTRMAQAGTQVALPVVTAKGQPLSFRRWTPGCAMTRGVWNIPIPAAEEPLVPGVVIAPLVGVDAGCYRLGYGGGFFDRTLARLAAEGARATAIGVGYPQSRISSIQPQPWDVPMDVVITDPAHPQHRAGRSAGV